MTAFRPESPEASSAMAVQPPEPAHRGMPWWEWLIVGLVNVALLAGIAHLMNRLTSFERMGAAAQVCEDLAVEAATQANRRAHPYWVYDASTTAVSEKDVANAVWWKAGTPSFQCQVLVSASEGIAGLRVNGEPTVDTAYAVRFTGVPNPQNPLDAQQVETRPVP